MHDAGGLKAGVYEAGVLKAFVSQMEIHQQKMRLIRNAQAPRTWGGAGAMAMGVAGAMGGPHTRGTGVGTMPAIQGAPRAGGSGFERQCFIGPQGLVFKACEGDGHVSRASLGAGGMRDMCGGG